MTSSTSLPPWHRWWITAPGLTLIGGILTSAVAWWLIAWPIASLANVARHPGHASPLYVHMLGGTIMLACGAANLYIGATRRAFTWHRLLGMTYMLGGGLGAVVALWLAVAPAHPVPGSVGWSLGAISNTGFATATLAAAWLLATSMAYRAIRNRRIAAHRAWMIRSYVLSWSFVFCRLASRVPAIGDLGSGQAFIWLSWVGPLLLCEVALQWSDGARSAGASPSRPVTGR